MRLQAALSARVIGLVVSVLSLVSCGGGNGGSTGTNVNAPVISNLRIQPRSAERANTNVTYDATADFTDSNGDLSGGQCEILLNGQSIGRATLTPIPGTPANLTSGFVGCRFFVNARVPQQIAGTFRVFDLAGNQSNDLSFVLGIAQLPSGSAPAGIGPVRGRMVSAILGR